jgi:hypothetical protein
LWKWHKSQQRRESTAACLLRLACSTTVYRKVMSQSQAVKANPDPGHHRPEGGLAYPQPVCYSHYPLKSAFIRTYFYMHYLSLPFAHGLTISLTSNTAYGRCLVCVDFFTHLKFSIETRIGVMRLSCSKLYRDAQVIKYQRERCWKFHCHHPTFGRLSRYENMSKSSGPNRHYGCLVMWTFIDFNA